jgi:hypothetical protein
MAFSPFGYRDNAGQFDPVMRVLQYLSLMNWGGSREALFSRVSRLKMVALLSYYKIRRKMHNSFILTAS